MGDKDDDINELSPKYEDSNCLDYSCSSPRNSLFQTVVYLVDDNINHFKDEESEQGQRLFCGLRALKDGLLKVVELGEVVRKEASTFDFSPEVPGNGFRSFSNLVQEAIICVLELCKKISSGRGSILPFRKSYYVKEVEAWGQTLASLTTSLEYIISTLLPRCENGNLMPEIECSTTELLKVLNTVPQYSFYGRCLGFHYHESLQKTLKFLNIAMCAFSEVYYSDGGFLQRTKQSLFTGSKYLMDPEQRARRIVDVLQYSSVDFIKSFWSLADTELLTQLPGIVGPTLDVTQHIIVPCENIEIRTTDDRLIVIPAPRSHLPPSPISCFLLSSIMREGMPGERIHKGTVFPPSDKIIFHCHGGGFVTQSTKAQEVFLREWAVGLQVPIFSIDYSLAPDAQYPRALEEVLTSFVWMLNNFKLLGTLGNKIICTGDSAGGNLLTALTIKCLELGVRIPDGLFLAYTPFNVKMQPTPARLLAVLDPMLPLGFALRCLKAYAGLPSNRPSLANSPNDTSNSASLSSPGNLSPTLEHPELDDVDKTTSPNSQKSKHPSKSKFSDAISSEEKQPVNQKQRKEDSKDLKEQKKLYPEIQNGDEDDSFVEVTEKDVREAEALLSNSKSFTSEPDTDTMTTVSLNSDPASKIENIKSPADQEKESKAERSRKYVSDFLEKYVLDSRTDKEGRKVPILRTGSEEVEDENVVFESTSSSSGIGAKLGRAKDVVFDGISAKFSSLKSKGRNETSSSTPLEDQPKDISPTRNKVQRRPSIGRIPLGTTKLHRDNSCSLLEEFIGVEVINDHYISPLLAPHSIFAQFPPVSILTTEYDFCLDDCITMAVLLRSLKVPIVLDVLDKLPHGFLNLNHVSKECHDGCKIAITRLKTLLGEDEVGEKTEL